MKKRSSFDKAFFSDNPIAILVIDPMNNAIIDANKAALKFYGYSYEVLTSLSINQINVSEQEVIKNEILLATQEKRNFFVFKHALASGLIKTVEVISTPILIDQKTYLFSMITDTTTLESFTERLIQSNHRLNDIVDMKNEALSKELSINRILLENLDDAVVLFNVNGKMLVANNTFHQMFGSFVNTYTVDLDTFVFKIGEICIGSFKERLTNVLSLNLDIKEEEFSLKIDNNERFFLITMSSLINENDYTFGKLFVIKDITSKKEAEILKLKAENKYREIFNNTPTGIVSINSDGIIDECNDEFVNMLGSSRNKLIGFKLNSIPNTEFKNAIDYCLIGERKSYDGWYTSVTGVNTIYMNAVFSPVYINDKVIGGLGVISDVTSIKNSEKLMESQMVRFEALFMNSPLAVVQFDSNHHVLKINESFTQLFGYTQEEVYEKELDGLLSNDDVILEMKGYTKSIFQGKSIRSHGSRASKFGDVIDVEIIGIPIIIDGNVIGGYSLYSDVREQLRIKEQLIVEKNNAEKANIAKAQFLANMSHEIRTPMNGFMGVLELLTQTQLNSQQKEFLRIANTSAQSLRKLVSDILDYSKIESSQLTLEDTPFDMYQLAQDVINLYKPSALQKGIELILDTEKLVLGNWSGDAYRIKQVLSNLVSNAIKFTDQGSVSVTIIEEQVRVNEEYKLFFYVKDTGIGIPSDKVEHIFERYGQAHERESIYQGGTGLGLSISKWIAEQMKGGLTVESTSVRGTTFVFSCTLTPSKVIVSQDLEDTFVYIRSSRELSILLADDDETSRYIMTQLATNNHWKLNYVNNGQSAVECCRNEKFDVILMDCQMPVLNGFEAAKLIRSTDNYNLNTPIIALTAFSQQEDINLCFESGMNYYFSKPIDYKGLVKKLNTIML